jgi:hypothetical protein
MPVAHSYNPSCSGGRDQKDRYSESVQVKSQTLSQKYQTQKRAGGVPQVDEHLPSKYEAQSSNPNTEMNKQINKILYCDPQDLHFLPSLLYPLLTRLPIRIWWEESRTRKK